MKKIVFWVATHLIAGAVGFALGIYLLPILTAPDAPTVSEVEAITGQAQYSGEFERDLEGSDFLHWGEGTVSVSRQHVALMGRIAPGPDYRLYLAPEFVETEAEFERLKSQSVQIGDVKVFENFVVSVPENVDPAEFTAVVVWCEAFREFITAARYR